MPVPWATLIFKGASLRRQPLSLNLLGACVRTTYWMMWEDDWVLPASGAHDLIRRAVDVCVHDRVHQVAVNGWGLDPPPSSAAGRTARAPPVPPTCEPPECETIHRRTSGGTEYALVVYPAHEAPLLRKPLEVAVRHFNAGNPANHVSYAKRQELKIDGVTPISWPLYSNQPSVCVATFIKSLMPFSEDPMLNRADHEYWRWEFEFAARFVLAGGRKATLAGPGLARQADVASSARTW